MKQLNFLLPFSLPPAELAADLVKALETPAFSMLVSRSHQRQTTPHDDFARMLPHEAWLASHFHLEPKIPDSSLAIAAAAMRAHGIAPTEGRWFMLHPVHIHIARDHLVLTDIRALNIAEAESRTLFDIAQPLFEENGKTLRYGDAHTWFLRSDDWQTLSTSTPDAACGHNIDIWMPKGEHERDWRRLQNEVQMHWHDHEINAHREARGLKPINSLWLWGGANADQLPHSDDEKIGNMHGWQLALTSQNIECDIKQCIADTSSQMLIAADRLIEAALAQDWSIWIEQFNVLETEWFAPLLTALQSGKLKQLQLICTNGTQLTTFTTTPLSLRKFWLKPSLAKALT